MNYLDIIFAIVLIWFAYKGYSKGFIIEIASLAALLLGIYAAMHFSGFTAHYLSEKFEIGNRYLPMISFCITFTGVVILVYFIGKFLERVANLAMLGFVNKLFGAVFSILKISFILSVIILILNSISIEIIPKQSCEKSLMYKPVEKLAPMVIPRLKELKDSLL